MVAKKVTVYLEGGGESSELRKRCREGFRKLFNQCGFKRQPKLVACGPREKAFDRFCTAEKLGKEMAFLLVDSEDPIQDVSEVWRHLKQRDDWTPPSSTSDKQGLLMTTSMETWIVTDRQTLKAHYQKLRESDLPASKNIEAVNRKTVFDSLVRATRDCKNQYAKGKRSFEVLAMLNPSILADQLPSFNRVKQVLMDELS